MNKASNRVELLTDASHGYGRVWRDFVKSYAVEPDRLYCFFEGIDDIKYYGPRIDNIVFRLSQSRRVNNWCEGKENVIRLHSLVTGDERYRNAWVAFFLDRDFDDPEDLPQSKSVYITPCYSIENFYADPDMISRILQDEFGITESEEEFSYTLLKYIDRLEDFTQASCQLNAWIYLQRKRESIQQIGSRMDLNNKAPHQLFSVSLDKIKSKYTFSNFAEFFPNSLPLSEQEVMLQVSVFEDCDQRLQFRGKYLLYFVREFLNKLIEDSNRRNDHVHFKKRRRVRMSLSENILSELTQYAETPSSLVQFLVRLTQNAQQQFEFNIT